MANSFDVKALRERISWTQDRMARYLGIDRSSVSRLESKGAARGPALKLLHALEDASHVSVDAANALCPELVEAAE